MIKVSDKKIIIISVILAFLLLTLFVTCSYAIETEDENSNNNWVIKSFDNTVVLLNDGEIIEVFGDIAVENLPNEDKNHLKNGISFLTKDEALLALEDYDG